MQNDAKYQKIIDWIKEGIENGELKYGDKLMSENELAKKFDLSRQTVRHATGELVEQQILTRIQGSGTYIGARYHQFRREKHHSIAVVSTFYESYIFPPTLKGIERVLAKNGYTMQVSFTDNKIYREREILQGLLEKDNIDGLIVEPAKSALPNPNIDLYKKIKEKDIPIIFFNTFYPDIDVPCVRLDDEKAAKKATELLIEAGHRNIGAVFKADDGQGARRYFGYVKAMMEAGIKVNQDRIVWVDTPLTSSMNEISEYLLKRLQDCTAVIGYNDQIAYQLIEIFEQAGKHVPENISVVGIDDSYLAQTGRVPLTSIPHPKVELGKKVADNLIRMIENPEYDGNYLYDSEPMIRESVKKL